MTLKSRLLGAQWLILAGAATTCALPLLIQMTAGQRSVSVQAGMIPVLPELGTAGVAIVASTLAVAFFALRSIRSFRRQLADAVRRIGTEEIQQLPLHGPSEFMALARAMNLTGTRLAAEEDRRRAAERTLDDTRNAIEHSGAASAERLRIAQGLSDCVRGMLGCADEAEFAALIGRAMPKIFPGQPGQLLAMNETRDGLRILSAWPNSAAADPFEPDACWALRRGRQHRSHETEARCPHTDPGPDDHHFCLPLVAHGEVLGLLTFEGSQAEELCGADHESLAEAIALALGNIRMRETLQSRSLRDPLTGLFNRRYIQESFELDLARAIRAQSSLACVMVDADHFKRFNDEFGHDAGDAILRHLGHLFSTSLRKGDVACRYGGEEFTLLLPGATVADAAMRAEAIRETVKSLTLIHRGRTLGPLTLSFGVAGFPENGRTTEAILEAADTALLKAKREGRDRVIRAQPYGMAEGSPERADLELA